MGVLNNIKEYMAKKVVVKKVEGGEEKAPVVVNSECTNCDGVSQCSVCTPVFSDTFGE